MQIRIGTVAVENGSPFVVASADADWTQAAAGALFSVPTVGPALYDILELRAPGVSPTGRWEATLSAAYTGPDNPAAFYQITKDFTPSLGLPLIQYGDVDTALLINRALRILDEELGGPGGAGKFWLKDAEDFPDSYAGQAGKFVRVNATNDGLEFAALTVPEADTVQTLQGSTPMALEWGRNYRIKADFSGANGGHFGTPVLSSRGQCSDPTVTMVPDHNASSESKLAWVVYTRPSLDPYASVLPYVFNAMVRGPGFTKHGAAGTIVTTWTAELIS